MRLLTRLLAICCALVSLPSVAVPLSDLYKVRQPVSSQQPADREQALRQAFDTLLLRLTGEEQNEQASVAALRDDPQQLISRYAYEGDAVIVDFDPHTTERALRSAGLSLWGSDRPSIMTWWLVESPDGTQLVGDAQEGSKTLQTAAQHRGLPLRLPLADLSEQLAATREALSASDPQALRDASERYDADGLLAVMVRQSDENWEASWQFWLGDERAGEKVSGDSREAVADQVMLAVSRFLAPQYRVAPGASEEITLEVMGANVARFAELDRLLEPFDGRLQRVESDRLVYVLRASPEQLRTQLALARLQEMTEEEWQVAQPIDAQASIGEPDEAEAQPGQDQPTGQPQEPEPAPQEEAGTVMRYRW
ncbi:DUF2066 domain-containing protein [Stutzerimonas stutzeri]